MNLYSFTAEGKPKTKQRPRMTRRGRVFTPQETLEAERIIAEQYNGPIFEGPIALIISYGNDHQQITIMPLTTFDNESKLRGDLDNYIKLTSDALNGIAFQDDRQIKLIVGKFL